MPARDQPKATFDWPIYADATFAGLAVLVPIPVLDWVFEQFFRRRMARSIARRRGRRLEPAIRAELNQSGRSCLGTCLTLPVIATVWLAKRISHKLLYVLTIKDATDQLSYYWQRAFLIDYMLQQGHLELEGPAAVARQAMEQVLESSASPLGQLAGQVIGSTHHILQTLWTARRGGQDEVIRQLQSRMAQSWAEFEGYFRMLAARYEQTYHQMMASRSHNSTV